METYWAATRADGRRELWRAHAGRPQRVAWLDPGTRLIEPYPAGRAWTEADCAWVSAWGALAGYHLLDCGPVEGEG